MAAVSLRATDVAPTPTPPSALMSRSTEAIAVSLAMPTAIEAPTATWLPWVWPVATVVCSLLWSAWLLYAPLMPSPAVFSPRRATVVLSPTETATTGVTEILAPEAPPSTLVPMVWSLLAFSPKLAPPVIAALSATSATVLLATTFTPTDAPTPTLASAPASTSAPAVTVLVEALPASIRMSPVPAFTVAPTPKPAPAVSVSPCTRAVVVLATVLIASEPATPTLPAPAPLWASATKSFLASASMPAWTVRPCALTLALSLTMAVLVAVAAFTATAAPMPTLVPPASVWLPSALAAASVSALLVTLRAPPVLVMLRPAPIDALVSELATLMPTAAATLTPPSLVSALGASSPVGLVVLSSFLPVLPPEVSGAAGALSAVALPLSLAESP